MQKKLFLYLISLFLTQIAFAQVDNNRLVDKPKGEYDVASEKLFLVDSLRKETFVKRNKKREIFVKIWYPIEKNGRAVYENFLEDYPTKEVASIFKNIGLDKKLVSEIQKTYTYTLKEGYSYFEDKKFPVVIFNPGFYFGMSDFYTTIIENLASYGYVVCCVNHPYEQPYVEQSIGKPAKLKRKKAQLAYLDVYLVDKFKKFDLSTQEKIDAATYHYLRKLKRFDKVVKRWTDDNLFLISSLQNGKLTGVELPVFDNMDIENIGIMGHSIGGATAGNLCLEHEELVKAGINLDCFQFGKMIDSSLNVPFMLMQSEHYELWNIGNSVVYRNVAADYYKMEVKNSRHFAFSDASFLTLIEEDEMKGMIGNIDGKETIETINKYIVDFFNLYLLDKESEVLGVKVDDDKFKFEKIK